MCKASSPFSSQSLQMAAPKVKASQASKKARLTDIIADRGNLLHRNCGPKAWTSKNGAGQVPVAIVPDTIPLIQSSLQEFQVTPFFTTAPF